MSQKSYILQFCCKNDTLTEMNELENFKTILTQKGASVTKTRLMLFRTLQELDRPAKTGEIVKKTPSVNRTSVYRTLELFSELGITTTIIRGWTPLTELAEPFKAHHHHVTCSVCGASESIESETLEDVLQVVAARHGYTLDQHMVELTGVCATCRAKKKR